MGEKWMYSIYAGIVFIIVASPMTYKFVHSIFNFISPRLGHIVSDARGLATGGGLIVHGIVFTLIVYFSMILADRFKKDY